MELNIELGAIRPIIADKNIPIADKMNLIEKLITKNAEAEAKAYANWLSNQVINGRTSSKLWNDYQAEIQ